MIGLKIRDFTTEDADDILSLHDSHGEWFERGIVSKDFILDSAERPDFRFFVADFNGKVVGFSGVLFFESVGRAELGPVCVERNHQRSGIGSRLVEETLNFLKGRNIRRVIVRVKSNNQTGFGFFRANGFAEEARFEKYTMGNESVVQMVRFL